MKILALSDMHGRLPNPEKFARCDIAAICGDITPAERMYHGATSEGLFMQTVWIRETFIPWLKQLPVKHVVLTWGNHDWCGDQDGKDIIPPDWWPFNVHMLVNESVVLDGVKYYGVPQTPRFFDWAFNEDDNEDALGKRWGAVDEGTDVLLSHGPPYQSCDRVGPRRVGSVTMARWLHSVASNRPKIAICGHLHANGGTTDWCHETQVYNVAILNEQYKIARPATVIDFVPSK